MKKYWLTIAFFLGIAGIITFVFSGCGRRENANVASETKRGKITLKIGLPGGYDVTPKKLIELFKKENPDINVVIDEAPWGDYAKRIQMKMISGDCPDVWFLEGGVIMSYGAMGLAEDLKPYIEKDLKKSGYTLLNDAADGKGHIWGVPHGLQPTALAYNIKMFQEAGIETPTANWDFNDLITTARKLTKRDATGKVVRYGMTCDYSNITQGYYPWIEGLGGHILDKNKEKALLNSPATIEAVKKWIALSREGITPSDAVNRANQFAYNMFGSQKGAMYIIQYIMCKFLNENYPELKYDVAPIPLRVNGDGSRYVPYVANDWVIYRKASPEAKVAAWRWLKFWLSEKVQLMVAEDGSNVPVYLPAFYQAKSKLPEPQHREFFVSYLDKFGGNIGQNATWMSWSSKLSSIIGQIYEGGLSIEDGLAKAQLEVQKVINEGI